mgnify:CR=1 FL=1
MSDRLFLEDRHFRRPALDPKEYKRIIYDPGIVTRIIMNRPRYLNASSHAELAELEDAFDRASEDEGCHVVVLSGAGTSFCSGDDNVGLTPESAPTLWDGDARPPEDLIEQYGSEDAAWHQYNIEHDYFIGWPFLKKLRTVPKPTIAMVHGYAIFMGYMLAGAMDLCFASEDALFLGGWPGVHELWTMGPRKVLEFAFEHRFMTAREALEVGMINRVFPTREILEKETMAFAYRVAHESPIALRRQKEAFLNMEDMLGYTTVAELSRTPYRMVWRHDAEEGHRMRYEGRGRARTPVALANLKAKLESEGAKVPQNVREALARAAVRDDKGKWQQVLHSSWRNPKRMARTDASAKAYAEWQAEWERKVKAEKKRRGLS